MDVYNYFAAVLKVRPGVNFSQTSPILSGLHLFGGARIRGKSSRT